MKGQSLIEVLVALATAVVIISAIVLSVTNALMNAHFSKTQNLATQYAQQGMEMIRKMRDSDVESFSKYNGAFCLDKSNTSLPAPTPVSNCSIDRTCTTPNIDNVFIREFCVKKNSSNCPIPTLSPTTTPTNTTEVEVKVFWTDSKCQSGSPYCHKVKLNSCLSDFSTLPTP